MLIDCDRCTARPTACSDCVVGVLLGTPEVPGRTDADDAGTTGAGSGITPPPREPGGPLPVEFGPVEQRALEVLADHGLIPRLRLVTAPEPEPDAVEGRRRDRADGRAGGRRRDVG